MLQLSRKVASTTCNRAYLLLNFTKSDMYFTWGTPFGIAITIIADMIDIDEAGVKLEHSNWMRGKTPTIMYCDDVGVYNRDRKTNLLLVISRDENYNKSWYELWEEEGTTLLRFYSFLERKIHQLTLDYPGWSFCFTMDKFNGHHNQAILNLICNSGHCYLIWAPYWSCDCAIEHVFNTIHSFLLYYWHGLKTMQDLENTIDAIIENDLGSFTDNFCHVGFRY